VLIKATLLGAPLFVPTAADATLTTLIQRCNAHSSLLENNSELAFGKL
jgi:hypothetical protein